MQVCAHRLGERAALAPGAQVLDVATGTGWAALAAGLTQVEFRASDAERLDLADQRFDVVLCASGLFFLPDMLAALREWHRVLTPGGQVAFSGFGLTLRAALAGPVGCAPAAVRGVRAHDDPGAAPGSARDMPAVAPGGRLCADRGPERATGLLSPDGGGVVGGELGRHLSAPRVTAGPNAAHAVSGRALAEAQALATAQGIRVDVPVNFAHGWKGPA